MTLRVTGENPHLFLTLAQGSSISSGASVLSMDYFSPEGIDGLYVYYKLNLQSDWPKEGVVYGGSFGKAETWQPISIDLKESSGGAWKPQHTIYSLKLEMAVGTEFKLRRFQIQEPRDDGPTVTTAEGKQAEADRIDAYLNASYDLAQFTLRAANNDQIYWKVATR